MFIEVLWIEVLQAPVIPQYSVHPSYNWPAEIFKHVFHTFLDLLCDHETTRFRMERWPLGRRKAVESRTWKASPKINSGLKCATRKQSSTNFPFQTRKLMS